MGQRAYLVLISREELQPTSQERELCTYNIISIIIIIIIFLGTLLMQVVVCFIVVVFCFSFSPLENYPSILLFFLSMSCACCHS